VRTPGGTREVRRSGGGDDPSRSAC
jgi:hypothetical protein